MNTNNIIVVDTETTSLNINEALITQIAAVAVNGRTFSIDDKFNSYIKLDDLSLLTDEVIKITGITKETLSAAPQEQVVFPKWFEWVDRFYAGKKGDNFKAPILAGWNIDSYDLPILNRYCKKYGRWDEKRNVQKLFNSIFTFDTMKFYWWLTRTNSDVRGISQPSLLEYCGMSKDEISKNAHNAIWDVEQTALLTIKILKLGKYLTEPRDDGTRRLELKGNLCIKQ